MNQSTAPQIGGSFAPPMDAKQLSAYRKLTDDVSPQAGEAMKALADMVELYMKRPAPKKGEPAPQAAPHSSGTGLVIPLPEAEVKRLWDAVPWNEELEMYATVFDRLPPGEARDAAFHLLWYGKELELDREPITTDRI